MTLDLSKGEFAALCKRAAKGAGYHWSLASEFASAAAWLCCRGASPADLADHLESVDATGLDHTASALVLGLWFRDIGSAAPGEYQIRDGMLLAPFVTPLGATARVGQDSVTVSLESPPSALVSEPNTRVRLDADTYERLRHLAHKSYAPATEESRLRGAGAADDPQS